MERTGALAAIGRTPVVRLDGTDVWVKLEAADPTGSDKDRMALALLPPDAYDEVIAVPEAEAFAAARAAGVFPGPYLVAARALIRLSGNLFG